MMKDSSDDRLLEEDVHKNSFTNPKKLPISTKYGYLLVTQQGAPNRPVIVTYHDVGYNSSSQFHDFFASTEMLPILEHFTIYHINAPGQEEDANPLPSGALYPTMDQLAESINDIFMQLDIKSAIGFGVGLGANVLVRFALQYPSKINGLILVNCIARSVRWLEGFSLKWPTKDVSEQRWTDSLMNYFIWYHLGPETQASHPDLEHLLRRHLEESVNVKNVIKLLNSFFKRTAILSERSSLLKKDPNTLKCSVLNITGCFSPHKDDVIDTNDRCDQAQTAYVEFTDCGSAVIDEQPAKLAESIRLFLQGLGYISHLSIPRYSTTNRLAEQVAEYKRRHGSFSRVPRRLSSQISTGNYPDDELQLHVDSLDNRKISL